MSTPHVNTSLSCRNRPRRRPFTRKPCRPLSLILLMALPRLPQCHGNPFMPVADIPVAGDVVRRESDRRADSLRRAASARVNPTA